MPRKGEKGRYNYGRAFMHKGTKVAYRYTDKKKSTKTLVDFKTKKPLNLYRRFGPAQTKPRYKK